MTFVKKDLRKWEIVDKTTMKNACEELSVYEIKIESKKLGVCFKYIGQVYDQTIYERYLQHISKNGIVRKTIDYLGMDCIDTITLKSLATFKRRNKERLNEKEKKLINKLQVDSTLYKRKKVYVLNTNMDKKEIIKTIIKIIKNNKKLLTN